MFRSLNDFEQLACTNRKKEKVITYTTILLINLACFSVIEELETKEETAPTPVKKGIFARWGSSKAKTPGTPPNSPEPVRTPTLEPEQGK